jgi:hypothetical protein
MGNFRKEDLVLDAKIYVYKHGSDVIAPAVIFGIEGSYPASKPYQQPSLFEESIGATVSFKMDKMDKLGTGTFYVDFSEEKNRRGTVYTGFPTKEDAQEFRKYLMEQKIAELQHQIENIKNKI